MIRRLSTALFVLAALAFYLAGQRKNPPAFFVDESCNAYNAYLLATRGTDEWGHRFPLFISGFGEYDAQPVPLNPTQIYLLAGLFEVVHPSNLAARRLAALCGFGAALLMAGLAWRMTRSRKVAALTLLTAIATPMLFEISRLAFEVSVYPLVTAAFLWSVFEASRRPRWSWKEVMTLGGSLVLLLYTYSIGRLLAPLLFATVAVVFFSRQRIAALAGIAVFFVALGILPIANYNRHAGVDLTLRFKLLSYVEPLRDKPIELAKVFTQHYFGNLAGLLFLGGDPNPRHHVPSSGGSMLLMIFILASVGAVSAIRRRDRFGIFAALGALIALVPASLTIDKLHTLRLSPFPLFLIALSIPALEALRPKVVLPILALGLLQATWFFMVFHRHGAERGADFDAGIGQVMRDAAAKPIRPIHVDIAAPVHAYWFGLQHGVDRTQLPLGPTTEHGALVVTDKRVPPGATLVSRHEVFSAYLAP